MEIPHELVGKTTVNLWPVAGGVLGLKKDSTYAAAKNGDIPTLRIGRLWLVPVAPLLKMLGLDEGRSPDDRELTTVGSARN